MPFPGRVTVSPSIEDWLQELAERTANLERLLLEGTVAAGAWAALETVNAKLKPIVPPTAETPEARSEGAGARGVLRGVYEVITAEVAKEALLFTVPPAVRPKTAPTFPGLTVFNGAAFSANRFRVATTGEAFLNIALPVGSVIYMDGVSWNLT